jgi:hypothetical protein
MMGTALGVVGDRVGWGRGTSLLVSVATIVVVVVILSRLTPRR